jgi:hypothetical protein
VPQCSRSGTAPARDVVDSAKTAQESAMARMDPPLLDTNVAILGGTGDPCQAAEYRDEQTNSGVNRAGT